MLKLIRVMAKPGEIIECLPVGWLLALDVFHQIVDISRSLRFKQRPHDGQVFDDVLLLGHV